MGKGKKPITGYWYSFGIHMGICRGPINALVQIKVGDKTAWVGDQQASSTFAIDKKGLFGGEKQEGGVQGSLQLLMGEDAQVAPGGLVAMLKHALPGFRRMVTCFYNGRIAANNPYPKAWKFRLRRSTAGWEGGVAWYPEKAMIALVGPADSDSTDSPTAIHAMNPAHMIYELITNREWGRGLPSTALNIGAFTAAADTLFAEGFGLCVRWTRRDSLQSFAQSIIDHIGAVVYSDRQTSLLTIKLIRKDYDPLTLPIYDTDSGLLEVKENEATALGPAINEIVVEYTDPISGSKRTVNAQNLAALQASRGVFNSLKKQYPALPTASLALRCAQRDLRVNAMSLRRFTLTFDRRAWRIPPAGVIRIRDTVRGIGDVVVRVGRIEDGTLTNGVITIVAVQDVFALPSASFVSTQPPQWTKPDNKPILKRHRAFEVPYFMLKGAMTPADFAYVEDDAGYLGTLVEKPSDLALAYDLYVKPSAPTIDDNPVI